MKFEKAWQHIKQKGSLHYKKSGYGNRCQHGDVEPIDLFRAGGMLKHFAIASIIKYAFRNRNGLIKESDVDKIIHYAEMLKFIAKTEKG